jgi:D-cysteine desulfhydrase
MSDSLAPAFPRIAERLPKLAIAELPTPVTKHVLALPSGAVEIAVKHDEATSTLYGGNKVRKLEYLLRRAQQRKARRVVTFGAVGSNHALATAIHAGNLGLECTCFLAHQTMNPKIAATLNMHRSLGTEIVRYGGGIDPLPLFRRYLQGRGAWVIPVGGTCWLGSVGFVNAGLELARQIATAEIPEPARIYMAAGTTGSIAGLVLGLAAAGCNAHVHAIQVADYPFSGEPKLRKLMAKTSAILNRIDEKFLPPPFDDRLVWRDEFLAGGYARVDAATRAAVETAENQLGLQLETTYTGKTLAAMLHDLQLPDYGGEPYLFWNTYNSRPLPVSAERPTSLENIPAEFDRYYASDECA